MEVFAGFICPNSPNVWDGNRLSTCFVDMVFGFGANVVTVVMLSVLWFVRRNVQGSWMCTWHKLFIYLMPALGVCLSFYDMIDLFKSSFHGQAPVYYKWFFRCSQFASWMTIMLFLKCENWSSIFCYWIMCIWWIVKPLLQIPHLQIVFSTSEAIMRVKESSFVVVEIIFGMYVNIFSVSCATRDRTIASLEDPLLLSDKDMKGDHEWSICNYWNLLTFKYANTMMDHGVVKQLDFEDLIQLPDELLPSTCHSTLLSCWVAEQSKNRISPSLFCALFHAYGWPYLRLGLLKVTNDAIGFLGPIFLNKLIKFLQRGSGLDGYVLAISLGLTSALKSFLDTQYTFRLSRLKLKLRSSIMTIVYCKCLHVSLSERSKFSEGEIQTFMSVDADRTVNLCNSFHDMWSLPLQIGVALYLLYTQVKFAFVSGIALTILLIPVNKYISTLIANATVNMMKEKDERIRTTGELLTYIRTLKMYGWELLFAGRLLERRTSEVKHLSTRKYLDAWCVFFWATTPSLFSLSTFGLYTLMGNQLDAATVFTCVALFNNLISPLNSFPWVITGLIDAIISTKRLSKFFSCSEFTCHTSSKDQMDSAFEDVAVVFQDACLVWSDNNKDQSAVLNGISLDLPKRSFIAVIGEIGSGKSSLLYSILREMQLIRGSVKVYGSLAYVSQVPWVLSGSLRDNILFGQEYDPQRYIEVLRACALDLDISRMAGGDLTYIGEKGYNLSGGQRARLALARAIYHGSDICILDDVLSAVDSQVASWILQNAILSPLMDQKTCVMCTHNVQAITVANSIVVMDKGHLKWAGSSANFFLSSYSTSFTSDDININSTQLFEENRGTYTSGDLVPRKFPDDDHIMISEEASGTAEIEEREEGNVALSVYKSYATFSSLPVVFLTCVSAALMQASRNGNDMWLSHWVDTSDGTTQSAHFYLVILLIFCIVNSLLTLVRAFSFSYGGLRAAVAIHSKLLRKLINARVSFFDRNPSGRILNRFSSDLYTIDDSLPFIMNILLANFFSLVGIAIILCYAEILFLLLLLPLMYIYRKLQFYYRSTSRELRRLDSVSRSPIYTSFTETLDGASTIRAFNVEEFFMSKFIKHVALYQRTSYSELSASLWLSLRLQLMAASVISFLAMVAVFGCWGGFPISFGTPGLVGLALSYATPVVSLLSSFLTTFTETEKEMVSVERVLQYMDIPQEELQGSQSLPADWPLHGNIEFEHVTLRYTKSSMDALKDVSFKIAAGMQVGIVGRTGAGKSSVINALFRLNPISHGHVLVDGLNIANIPVRDLRAHLAVVPQSPFLFEGRLRENVDPSGLASDSKIWEVLEKCHVKEEIEAAGGLDIHVKEAGVSFSVGQRQLICLARALLKSSKVLCLDECTANVDAMTTSLLQKTLFDECKGITVIVIAHRISVVMSMDNILILDNGFLVEQGNPQALLQDQSSRFSGFARASTM